MKRGFASFVMMVVCVGRMAVPSAHAHAKDYLATQDYYTAKRGEIEVGIWNNMNFVEADRDESYTSLHQLEVEYGLLDHLQLAYYEVHRWDRADDWERAAFKVEGKLRFAEAGAWPVDVALYAEYENPNGRRRVRSDVLENKVILSRDFGPWNVIGNVTFEKPLNNGDPWALEYTAGVSYGFTPRTRLGLELKETLGDMKEFGAHRSDHELYLVPGLYTSLTPDVRLLVGPAFGLTKASDDVQLRSLVEVEF